MNQHTLDHLGSEIREWANDLSPFPADDAYMPVMVAGVEDELASTDFAELLERRDGALLRLIADKRASGLGQ